MHKNAHARKLRDLTAAAHTHVRTHAHTYANTLSNTHTQFKLWTKLRDSCLVYRCAQPRRLFTLLQVAQLKVAKSSCYGWKHGV